METQRIKTPDNGQASWTVLDDKHHPAQPIQAYISYLRSMETSANPVHVYNNY